MTEKFYTGGCHCGAVRFEVALDLDSTMTCNCSICTKKGFVWAFTPATRFKLVSGDAFLADYLFYKHAITHRFCRTCGTEPFATGKHPEGYDVAAINVRCLDDIDLAELSSATIDGRSV